MLSKLYQQIAHESGSESAATIRCGDDGGIVEHGGDKAPLFKRMYRLALVQRDTLGTDMLQQLAVEWGEQADAS